uniref:Putative RNA-dependent RNA polymerase n=1 Tax=Dromedary picobirnavirus TaxID=1574421 RepID=A0A0A1EKY5_9VIRU|nr:putative RNA-dependent RNA polymerase [Dromedary picobirnavirus]
MRAKAGPMSVQKPLEARMDDILAYYSLSQGDTQVPDEVITQLMRNWSRMRGLEVRSQERTIANMKMSTNSGSPNFTKRNWVIDKLLPFDISYLGDSDWLLSTPEGKWLCCAVLGWRGQEGGPNAEDVKQRVLWMFTMAANIRELQVYQPLIEAAQRTGIISSWLGNDAVDQRITQLFDTKKPEDLIVCTDFSKFDQHFNPGCQASAKRILEGLFNGSTEFQEWCDTIYPIKYGIPMCYDVEKFITGWHGMASGSGGTNADETLFHSSIQLHAAMDHGSVLNSNSMCLGDDGLLSYPGIKVEDVVDCYRLYGQDMNLDKQYASSVDCTYLRRWHHTDYRVRGICVGVYPTIRALTHLRMLERYIDPDKWGVKAVAMRNLSVINNCEYHPLGEQFVEFCMKGDKYRLGLDIPGFMDRLDEEYREAKANDTLYVSYSAEYGDPRPPSQWWVTKTLKKLG